ncbi:MAG: single-stranded-DNA-specific exonuclease RecJ [Blautia sp.]|nr:single-stranded-DNA-specific exonuclease RecJ [Blautia sp.]
MEKWVVTTKSGNYAEIGKKHGIDPVLARIIRNRGIQTDEEYELYLRGTMKEIPSPHLLKDCDKAAALLLEKIREHKKIRVIGDYDIDGVTATYILMTGLRRLGADVDTYIPKRIEDGYGIHAHLITEAYECGIDTIVTCDNGIAAGEEIRQAVDLGMTVVVTDHHEVPYEEKAGERIYRLPPAHAVVNPRQSDCSYPNRNICGAVVAYKLICVLYELAGIPAKELEAFLEPAAIATVGDVMELQGENRILVKEGLRRLLHSGNPGLRGLIRCCGIGDGRKLTAYHIGFILGPCINASGRLDTAARALALLDCREEEEAFHLAEDLKVLNDERKDMTEKGKLQAIDQVENEGLREDRVLVIYLPECHESLAGIIAGRVREKYNKPVFVLTDSQKAVKGSGRSIEAYSMYEELVKCEDLLLQFGGHPLAAGLSLEKEKIGEFRRRLNENCTLTEEDLVPKIHIDIALPLSYLSLRFARSLELLEPFGKGNEKPVFACKGVTLKDVRVIGKNQNVVKMQAVEQSGACVDAIWFGDTDAFLEFAAKRKPAAITYYPEINTYRGVDKLQIVIQNYR